ncbi:ABC-type branched-subunit amino acid transport system substrate-binding protein [Angulomicrobium tetraedrale]|uniref:ABC-type branched-subunit amino acid transport system substrate-binding protein n=1 Tax=Ancylobacter tetraedralis TaxID=217068 RepID=A0A839Z4Q8_9HYPH|nr:penicillin-binding protein activator [Ancylobacter tetraedralis]MBB3770599.1 ABC-type branched-subunit amino acid transport system substrate-binding protein [Ancylobacter tetraedralis]
MDDSFISARRRRRVALQTSRRAFLLMAGSATLAACGSTREAAPPQAQLPPAEPVAPQQPANVIGGGAVRVALILPLGASGNAALAAQSLRNAAEMAMAEFTGANIQILVRDDGGSGPGAQAAAQQAMDEGARAIIGPVFAHTVAAAGLVARPRGVPVVGFSTDTNVATQGVYLLSFLPQTDVERAVRYAASIGRRGFVGLVPDNAYGSVVEAAFRETVPATGGRILGLERYGTGGAAQFAEAARRLAPSATQADALFLPDAADAVPQALQALQAAGVQLAGKQLIGTGLWDDRRLFAAPSVAGGLFAAPDPAGFRAFAERYRARYSREPVRTATLSYDAVTLMAALVAAHGESGISDAAIQNPSGFTGIDGIFRFRADGTNQRGLAVMQIGNGAAQIVSPAPRSFAQAT